MEVDKILYKEIMGECPDFKEKKDCLTMIAIHYLLNRNNIYDKSRIALEYEFTEDGLASAQWVTSIRARELVHTEKPLKFSDRARIVLDSIKIAINRTSSEFDIGKRTLLMQMASLAYLEENVYKENETVSNREKIFNEKLKSFSGFYSIAAKGMKRMNAQKKKLKEEMTKV